MESPNQEGLPPLISILTPIYTGHEFLKEAALSVFLQILKMDPRQSHALSWEWIIGINGHGESGGSPAAAALDLKESWEASGGGSTGCQMRVFVFGGPGNKVATLNQLVERARGRWIALLDVDDTWERNKLISQAIALATEARDADVIGTFCYYFGDITSSGPVLPPGWLGPEHFRASNPLINSSVLIRRRLARWEERYGLEDYDLWLRLLKSGARFYNLPQRLVHHRLWGGSAFNGAQKGVQDLEGLRRWHGLERGAVLVPGDVSAGGTGNRC